jgi:dethiobiotin synthetase
LRALFVTGIGTGIGKTIVSAILTEALYADYWKPIQAGHAGGTDSDWIRDHISNPYSKIFPETYRLIMAASPHIAAREEAIRISVERIVDDFNKITSNRSGPGDGAEQVSFIKQSGKSEWLIVEGAGGLLVPLNEREFVSDLALKLQSEIILVSRNYLGSINHSLLTSAHCRNLGLPVLGWIFNDQYLDYEAELTAWSGIRRIASIPFSHHPDKEFIKGQADLIREPLNQILDQAV